MLLWSHRLCVCVDLVYSWMPSIIPKFRITFTITCSYPTSRRAREEFGMAEAVEPWNLHHHLTVWRAVVNKLLTFLGKFPIISDLGWQWWTQDVWGARGGKMKRAPAVWRGAPARRKSWLQDTVSCFIYPGIDCHTLLSKGGSRKGRWKIC